MKSKISLRKTWTQEHAAKVLARFDALHFDGQLADLRVKVYDSPGDQRKGTSSAGHRRIRVNLAQHESDATVRMTLFRQMLQCAMSRGIQYVRVGKMGFDFGKGV